MAILRIQNPDGLPGMDTAVGELEDGLQTSADARPVKLSQSQIDAQRQLGNQLGERGNLDWNVSGGQAVRLGAALGASTGNRGPSSIEGDKEELQGPVHVSDLLYAKQTDKKHTIALESAITTAEWSRKRVWHGEEVKLHVATLNVSNGSELVVRVYPAVEAAPPPPPRSRRARLQALQARAELAKRGLSLVKKPVHEIKETISDNLWESTWKVDLSGKKLSGRCRVFTFEVTIPELGLKKKSVPLWIDLDSFCFSL